tara:strand:- start:613 stop:804 length:192 start_codon:yes stop_codon:yes gene_type:complete
MKIFLGGCMRIALISYLVFLIHQDLEEDRKLYTLEDVFWGDASNDSRSRYMPLIWTLVYIPIS